LLHSKHVLIYDAITTAVLMAMNNELKMPAVGRVVVLPLDHYGDYDVGLFVCCVTVVRLHQSQLTLTIS